MGFTAKKEGNRLFDLVKALGDLTLDDFLLDYTQPVLLQIPVEGAFSDLQEAGDRVTKPLGAAIPANAASTLHLSVEDLGGLRRSKNVEQALVHFLPDQPLVTLGRAPECDLVLSVTGVSRKHAELTKEIGRWLLTDLGSHNGSFLNGKKLEPNIPTPVKDKNNLWFGSYRALFLFPEQVYNLALNLRKKST